MSRRMAEEDRGRSGPTGRVFAATGRPQGTPLRLPDAKNPAWRGRVSGARGRSLARAGLKTVPIEDEDSTNVRRFQDRAEPWRRNRVRVDWWGEMAQVGGIGVTCVERAWGTAGARVAQESDGFFGCGGGNGLGGGRVAGRGWRPSRDRDTEDPIAKPKAQAAECEKPARKRTRTRRRRTSTPEKKTM